VREFFNRRLHEFLVVHKDDREMLLFLRITRPFIYESAFDELAEAFATGWAGAVDPASVYSELGETLAAVDEARAVDVFTRILEDPTAMQNARAAAAMCLARIPTARPKALEFLLRDENQAYVLPFVKGLKWGRFGEAYLNRNADESQDPKVRIGFLQEWIPLQRQVAQLLDEIAARARPEVKAAVEVDANREYLKGQIAAAEARLEAEKRAAGD
jgi:hypothetical protein